MKRRKPKVAIGQIGGPTAVINATLSGFLEKALTDYDVYGLVSGLQGLAENRLMPLNHLTRRECTLVSRLPGAWLGSGRWRANMQEYISTLRKRDIHSLVLIGGNGTMYSCMEIERQAKEQRYELEVIGLPKTVDNDLAETDHAPGFGSAARFVATMVRDSGIDLFSMRNFENVRVLETMGRNVGWLALASGYLKHSPHAPPHLIYVPESKPSQEEFLKSVQDAYRAYGYVVAVVSEGLAPPEHNHLERPVIGGVALQYARLVDEELGLTARGEPLGMGQRSYSFAVSRQDFLEAKEVGREAYWHLRAGNGGGFMVAVERLSADGDGYEYGFRPVKFDKVAGIERQLPEEWTRLSTDIPAGYRKWLGPLVNDDLEEYLDPP